MAETFRFISGVTVHVAGVPTDDLTPVFYGVKAGLYQKAGLDVQIVPTSSGTAATTAVVAGTYEIESRARDERQDDRRPGAQRSQHAGPAAELYLNG